MPADPKFWAYIAWRRSDLLIILLLCVMVFSAFWSLSQNFFVAYDDPIYITQNPSVSTGIHSANVAWAFTNVRGANFWHPLTWLSIMLDVQLFGMNPAGHHCSNLLLHLANTSLLFFVLRRMTGSSWRSGVVAALFAVHPLHVESVSWASQRKDTLSTLFWMLTLWAYARYADRENSWGRYTCVLFLFALGLMAKPMLVTLPFVLMLLDYWPLARGFRIRDTVPLILLALMAAVVAYFAQSCGGTLPSLQAYSIWLRLGNALVSYVSYIGKMFWPVHLTCFYPHPGHALALWKISAASTALVGITFWAWRERREKPYVIVGWLWYVGTLLPVSGLVQVGGHAMADRYTYVPLIGLFLALAWLLPLWGYKLGLTGKSMGLVAGFLLLALMARTSDQVAVWRDGLTLMQHNVRVNTPNVTSFNLLGEALLHQDRYVEAIAQYEKALTMSPDNWGLHYNLANALAKIGKLDDAIAHYQHSLRFMPDDPDLHNNMALVLVRMGKTDEALHHYDEALRIDPAHRMARDNRQLALERRYEHSSPDTQESRFDEGVVLARQGKNADAIRVFTEVLEAHPDLVKAHYNLGVLWAKQGETGKAEAELEQALRLQTDFSEARDALRQLRDDR